MKKLTAVLNKKNSLTPIWLMRQAGRYLPEYKALRKNYSSFIEFCLTPEAALEATIQPLKRFDLDAAIIFSDILIVPHALGAKVEFKESEGPILTPFREMRDLDNSEDFKLEIFDKVGIAIKFAKKEIDISYKEKTLIGFAGSPWTVCCYMVEGKGSKDFSTVKKFAYTDRETFNKLINLVTKTTIEYLKYQIESGAEVIQLFDSWAYMLSENEFLRWVIEPTKMIVSSLKAAFPNIPIIGFPKGVGVMYERYAKQTGVDAVSIDQGVPLDWAANVLQKISVVQGNLDNAVLFGDKDRIKQDTQNILDKLSSHPFIFNLGHGILPETPIQNVEYLVNLVKEYRAS